MEDPVTQPFAVGDGLTARYAEDTNYRYVMFHGVNNGVPMQFTLTSWTLKQQPLLRAALERMLGVTVTPTPLISLT